MRAVLIGIGSSGDVHPVVGIGQALVDRGHEVCVVTNGHFESLVRGAGLEFVELTDSDTFDRLTSHPDLWHPRKGIPLLLHHCCAQTLAPLFETISDRYVPGDTIVAATALGLGARVAQDKLGVPTASLFVQPQIFRSVYDTPITPQLPMPRWMPVWCKRAMYRFADLFADHYIAPAVNAFRDGLSLPPVRRIFHQWWISPDLLLGLFPAWFGPPQPDWPAQTRVTDFPMYDESDLIGVDPGVAAFVADGPAPIVFTPGSAMRQGAAFFREAVDACRLLGRRGLLLNRDSGQIPRDLPGTVRHFDYVPLSWLLPRASAMVSHGGIGTLAQTLRAGIPHLVMPMISDQPDNAARLKRLGVGDWIRPSRFRSEAIAAKLEHLLTSAEVSENCRAIARRFIHDNTLAATCDSLEDLCGRTARSSIVPVRPMSASIC